MRIRPSFPFLASVCLAFLPAAVGAQEDGGGRSPQRFAIIFNRGYAGDHLPGNPAEFEKLVVALKGAHFNVILGAYRPERARICRKHEMQFFVDLLVPEHHVYKNVKACRKLCTSLRGDPAIYGYHLWSDNIGGTGPGRSRDAANVRQWDPTHPAYVGCYRMSKMSSVAGMDLFGYYDFHWTRGGHWGNLARAFNLAKDRGIGFLRYDAANPGLVGKGNPNRAAYTIATSIPFGLKGYTYHYAGGVVKPGTWTLDLLGEDLKKVNARFAQVGPELMQLSLPTAVYSAAISRTAKNDPLPAAMVPGGLAPVPDDHWFRLESGEVLVGVAQDREKRAVLMLANHNPYQSQKVTLAFSRPPHAVEFFDRSQGRWTPLRVEDGRVRCMVEDYGVELVRVRR